MTIGWAISRQPVDYDLAVRLMEERAARIAAGEASETDRSIGEMVMAIGNPLGLRHSVTSGIISATERISPGLNEKLVDFLPGPIVSIIEEGDTNVFIADWVD